MLYNKDWIYVIGRIMAQDYYWKECVEGITQKNQYRYIPSNFKIYIIDLRTTFKNLNLLEILYFNLRTLRESFILVWLQSSVIYVW